MTQATVSSLSVVLPAHNEESVIEQTVQDVDAHLRAILNRYEIIVVDDGSRDRTGDRLRALQSSVPTLRIVSHTVNRGYGAALRSGFFAARLDHIFFMDADGQFSIDDLDALLSLAGPRTIVAGYRRQRGDRRHRILNATLWNSLIRLLFHLRVRDLDCAFKLFPRALLQEVELVAQGAFVNAELLILATRRGYTVHEVPVRHFPRTEGRATGANPRVVLRAFRELMRFYRNQP